MLFDKSLFIEIISEIQKQFEYDEKCCNALKIVFPSNHISKYNNDILVNVLLKILKIQFNDNQDNSILEYFIFDLDFGKKYYEGCISDNEGKSIILNNTSNLYDYLVLKT